jgi:hypothetical protein
LTPKKLPWSGSGNGGEEHKACLFIDTASRRYNVCAGMKENHYDI